MTPHTATDEAAAAELQATATTELNLDTARAMCRLPGTWSEPLEPSRPSFTFISLLTRDLVNAGLPLHDCDVRERTGGVCLTPTSQDEGVVVSWTTHTTMATDPGCHDLRTDVLHLMNDALANLLIALGWHADPYGRAHAFVVTGRARPITLPGARRD